ncbi:MAG: 5-formyltetrahydrofolate cyclo-ligase [Deltaproteobacteria bacterium]|nr:5-formyltetrahydrofolate cyclo-ligase [Deltaproteobacteria bacterium]
MTSKPDLRKHLAAQRRALHASDWSARSAKVQASLLADPLFTGARAIALYRPMGNEVDTAALHEAALTAGKRVAYPDVVSDGAPMRFVLAGAETPWRLGHLGFEVPASDQVILLEDLELFVLPGLGFDRAGRRLGRGAGHYDRTLGLPLRAPRVGLAFEFQLIDAVPEDPWDVRLDAVATELGVIRAPPPLAR